MNPPARERLTAVFRLLAGIGILLLLLVFLRACLSPPMLPPKGLPTPDSPPAAPPDRY
ncbi:MAG: hypothetical protein ACOY33_07525 [Pseudomonadota bacterium]